MFGTHLKINTILHIFCAEDTALAVDAFDENLLASNMKVNSVHTIFAATRAHCTHMTHNVQ